MRNALTPREQELFIMLLKGTHPKEISNKLNITYNTFLFHQKSLYRKLGVHSTHELYVKYPSTVPGNAVNGMAAIADKGFPADIFIWSITRDDLGTSIKDGQINIDDIINEKIVTSCALSGYMPDKPYTWAGIYGLPEPATLAAMKKMTSFSFTVLPIRSTRILNYTLIGKLITAPFLLIFPKGGLWQPLATLTLSLGTLTKIE